MDDRSIAGAGVAVLSLGAAIFAPFLAGPALIAAMVAGGIALKDPKTPLVVKAAIWGSYAGLYGFIAPGILTAFFGDDLGELAGLALIFKLVGGAAAIAALAHLAMALKGAVMVSQHESKGKNP